MWCSKLLMEEEHVSKILKLGIVFAVGGTLYTGDR